MKITHDAVGREFLDYLGGKSSWEVVERDDGYIEPSPGPKVYFTEYGDWSSHVKKAMRHAKGRVLDIGCGAGRHSLYLQSRGHDVLGVDVSPLAVRVCKLRGLRRAEAMDVTQVSRSLGVFDTVLMLGNNFGLFRNPKTARWLLRRLRGVTSERARIIAETVDPYDTTNPCHLRYHKLNRKRGRMSGQIRLRVRYQTYATPWFDYLFVSRPEMKSILEGTGWGVERFIDSKGPAYVAILNKE
jgi:SAM-dependent methyltransferase